MSFDVVVHRRYRLVYIRAWAVLDVSSLLKLRHEILTHPAFEPGFDLIADVSELDTAALKLADMSTIAKLQLWKPAGKRALLVQTNEQRELAQAFSAFREHESVFIGRYLVDALDWLGHPSRAFDPTRPDMTPEKSQPSGRDVVVTRRVPDGSYTVECASETPEHFGPRQWSEARLAVARRAVLGATAWFKDEMGGGGCRPLDLVTGTFRDD